MPRKFSKWLRDKLANKPATTTIDPATGFPAGMPVLLAQRPRPLTPSTTTNTAAAAATADSPFFQRLPAELRRHVLTLAFGARTLHMDLEFRPPSSPRAGAHCDLDERARNAAALSKHARWHWWGSACHRVPVQHQGGVLADGLWRDACRHGIAACEQWAGAHPARCQVGAMGWLRACRRAYREGVEVLYATNVLHASGLPLLMNLSRLLLPQALGMVTAVEMVWDICDRRSGEAWRLPMAEREVFRALVRGVPEALPNLVKLSLSVWGHGMCVGERPRREAVDEVEREFIEPLDTMVLELVELRLRACTVEVPESLFLALNEKERGCEAILGLDEVFWRSLSVKGHGQKGYWIKFGIRDTQRLTCVAF
ncbi:hypothetical protein B0J12DRAFT_662017 [Macrophomina phaseolina]|uniref:DUF7730 domain-containing protein n=1 Tax=Macrophomina phaseolina TaxID=35725 RepID=A0ABQ8GBJ9_9PEZI|nr:hypothetical protein B0J12DRAFT_662017 [Macrophomina phaseolina]